MKIVQEYSSTLTGELHSTLVSFSLNLCDTIVLYNKLGFCIPHYFAENMSVYVTTTTTTTVHFCRTYQ